MFHEARIPLKPGLIKQAYFQEIGFNKGVLDMCDPYHGNVSFQTRSSFGVLLHLSFNQCYNQSARVKHSVILPNSSYTAAP